MRRVLAWLAILSAPAATAFAQTAADGTEVDASRGGVTISSGVNSLTIGARMQARWLIEDKEQSDADTSGRGVGDDDGPRSEFDVPRLRISLSGGVYRPWMRYQFQFEFSRTGGENASKIKDAVFEVRPVGRDYRIAMGQFKAPFGLQQLTSSGRQQFVDRSITDSKFSPGREMGAMFSGTAADGRLGYAVGAFNGSGESVTQNTRSPLFVGRVFLNPIGEYALAEGSADAGEQPVLHVGLAARSGNQIRGRAPDGVIDDADRQTAVSAEFAVKSRRFFSTVEHFWMSDERDNPVSGATIQSRGYHAQASYMIVPPRVEVAVRYAAINPDTDVDDAQVRELRGVLGYYWQGHGLKLLADVGRIGYDSQVGALSSRARQGLPSVGPRLVSDRELSDIQFRVEVTLAF